MRPRASRNALPRRVRPAILPSGEDASEAGRDFLVVEICMYNFYTEAWQNKAKMSNHFNAASKGVLLRSWLACSS